MSRQEITRADIMAMDDYAAERKERRAKISGLKELRRLPVGPFATFHFECYETMWMQIHEMLYIEKGGEAQIADELAAYNPLIPDGRELVATLMFGIPEAERRARILATLGGVEDRIAIEIDGEPVAALPEGDVERSRDDGKTSAVHFLHFPFTDAQIAAFRDPGSRVTLSISHPNYGHIAVFPEALRQALAADFD
ncbi:MAG: DUF3501 family protein [Alphaproteobacteria bacterium]|jgi:hypothetical protein|nr:DUF3501 family protein [Alphaproteobacteria bacterium]